MAMGKAPVKREGDEICMLCLQNPSECICEGPREDAGMGSYQAMLEREEQEREANLDLPPLAREREKAAIAKANAVFDAARELASTGMLTAVGYRVIVKPMEGTLGLEEAEAEVAPTLLESGFQVKSQEQLQREERGENHGVVIDLGPVAFERMGGRAAWCDVGDVVVFARYAGTRVEHPRGSGIFYQIMNDEDIAAKIK